MSNPSKRFNLPTYKDDVIGRSSGKNNQISSLYIDICHEHIPPTFTRVAVGTFKLTRTF